MKFKQILKDNIKRISAVILCMILMFTCVVPVLAYTGEAPSKILTANDLKEYIGKSYVYFDADSPRYGKSPVYSPFNLKTLDAVLSISTSADSGSLWDDGLMSTFEPSVYLSVSTGSIGRSDFKTRYIIPSVPEDVDFWDELKELLSFGNSQTGWNSYFYALLKEVHKDATLYNSSTSYRHGTIRESNFSRAGSVFNSLNIKSKVPTLVYEVSFKTDGTISSIAYGGCYESPDLAVSSLGTLNYVSQIAMYSIYDALFEAPNSSATPIYNPVLRDDIVNLNQYISTSTYSLTAIDYFAYDENVAGSSTSLLSNFVSIQTNSSFVSTMEYLYIPSHFLREEYRDAAEFTQIPCESAISEITSYNSIYETGKSWVFIPYNSNGCYGGYFIEFPDGANSALYLKLLTPYGSSGLYYTQLVSKVSYNLYCSMYDGSSYGYKYDLLGSFDAENTIYTGRSITFKYQNYQAVDYYNNITPINGTSVNKYPSILISSNASSSSLSELCFGTHCVVSIFPTNNTVGFYYYISPENMPNIISGSSSYNPDLGDGERPSGSLDWENFWDITVDYENLYPDGFDLNLPDYPQINIELGSMESVFDIPDLVVDYLVEVLDWLSESATIFVDSVGGPVRKTYYIAFMVLDAIPDVFSFMIIFSVAILLFFKILQAASATSYMVSTSAGSDKPQKSGKPKEKAKSEKQDNGKSGGK